MKRLKSVLIALFFIGAGSTVFAQTGGIKGIITDAETGETLIGVNVLISGTSFGAATGLDGDYEIDDIRAGEYTVRITYIGYETVLLTAIKVEEGEFTELNYKLKSKVLTSGEEIVVIGERPIFDVEKSTTSSTISRKDIEAAPVRKVEDAVSLQSGVIKDPTGLYIKGGRAYETGYVVDGVSAQDPLAGTGFGLDLGANSFSNIEVITGGVGAEYGDVTSGVVSVKTRNGGDTYEGSFSHKRDNFGSNVEDHQANYFQDVYEISIGGPGVIAEKLLPKLGLDIPGKITFYATAQVALEDGYTKIAADQIQSSISGSDFWSPRQGNRWNGMLKLTYNIKPGMRLQAAYQRSLTINQNTRMLQITGADTQVQPGFQFAFSNGFLDNANTYTHDSNLSYLKWTQTLSTSSFYEVQVSRLFTQLRADANGRDWRPDVVDGEFDPESIVTFPGNEFEGTDDFTYILAGPGYFNNGGIATLWHDHFAEEITVRSSYTKLFGGQQNQLVIGFESKFNDYQWIDITRPWIGAPIRIDENTVSETFRVGENFDAWRVKPNRGALFITEKIRYNGLIANIGGRFEYWAPGRYVDERVEEALDPNVFSTIPTFVAEQYQEDSKEIFGLRYKFIFLPKINVSFPVRENQVLFFNYGHSARIPHPSFVYAGLDPFFQDQSDLPSLGNPNLNREVDISYEIGLRNQITSNDALNISAFWRDKYDFVTSQSIRVNDVDGRPVTKAFRINGDYARSRGVEVSYLKRYRDLLRGQLSVTYSRAEGLSSTNDDNLSGISGSQNVGNNIETPLAWDRPFDIKGNITFTHARENGILDSPILNDFQLFVSAVWRSGARYTPFERVGTERNPISGEENWRPIYEQIDDPAKRYSEVGPAWFYMDFNLQKWFTIGETRVSTFLEISNFLNNKSAVVINPVTGEGYKQYPSSQAELIALRDDRSYDVPNNVRDPRYLDPTDNGLPRYENPANFLQQRHIVFGLSINF
ncbi:MAG: TonB-dependent receptor [Balneola sp.]|tara:strand:- start:113977 stop:116931 length:2955 start_codon:yes stop_codon:yes gene_type:complete